MIRLVMAGLLVGICGLSQAALAPSVPSEPDRRALTHAVNEYLVDHGDLCIGKFSWPRVVTPEDRENHSNDAVQLPVLEQLGLVESTEVPSPAPEGATTDAPQAEPARSYSLTAKGRRYYLQKKHITLGIHDQAVQHDADLCVARLKLDKVVKWTPPEVVHGQVETVVRYTYHVKPVDWMADPRAREVFPVVDRIIRGEGSLLMTVTVQRQDDHWRPVLPGQ
jgi:hypothetical protein